MAASISFDITSTIDLQEVDNAVNQARKEIGQRYDFKGSKASIDLNRGENILTLVADDDFKMDAVWDVLQTRLVRRGIPVKNMTPSETEPIAGGLVKRTVTLQQGIPSEAAKAIVKYLKDQKTQGAGHDPGRSGARVVALQGRTPERGMQMLRAHDFDVELQFGNYRS